MWAPFRFDVSKALCEGENRLRITVTNTPVMKTQGRAVRFPIRVILYASPLEATSTINIPINLKTANVQKEQIQDWTIQRL